MSYRPGRYWQGSRRSALTTVGVPLQQWIAEAFALWGVAAIVVVATALASHSELTAWIYRVAALLLAVLPVLTGLTGARTPVAWFKVCPAALGVTAGLILVASIS